MWKFILQSLPLSFHHRRNPSPFPPEMLLLLLTWGWPVSTLFFKTVLLNIPCTWCSIVGESIVPSYFPSGPIPTGCWAFWSSSFSSAYSGIYSTPSWRTSTSTLLPSLSTSWILEDSFSRGSTGDSWIYLVHCSHLLGYMSGAESMAGLHVPTHGWDLKGISASSWHWD